MIAFIKNQRHNVQKNFRFGDITEKTAGEQICNIPAWVKSSSIVSRMSSFFADDYPPYSQCLGTMGLELSSANPRPKEGKLYCLNKDLSVSEKVSPVDISNGLSWTSDNTTMYYCDTFRVSDIP